MVKEALTLSCRYLDEIETLFNRLHRVNGESDIMPSNENILFPPIGKPIWGFTYSLYLQKKSCKRIIMC